MTNIREILTKMYKKYKNYTIKVPSNKTRVMQYKYKEKYDVVIGLLMKSKKGSTSATLDEIYLFDNRKNVYCFEDGDLITLDDPTDLFKIVVSCDKKHEIHKVFSKLFDDLESIVFINGDFSKLKSKTDVREFYRTKENLKKSGKTQTKIDNLVSQPLKEYADVKEFKYSYKYRDGLYSDWSVKTIAKLEHIENDLSVIRIFFLLKKPVELLRIYIKGDKITKCRINTFGEWVSAGKVKDEEFDFFFRTSDLTDDFKDTKLWYYKDIIKNSKIKEGAFSVDYLIKLFRNPFLEQLYKIGFTSQVDYCGDSIVYNNIYEVVEDWFGYCNKGGKNVHQIIGLNNYQCNKLIGEFHQDTDDTELFLTIARDILGKDLTSIDNNTFDYALDFYKNKISKELDMDFIYFTICELIEELKTLGKSSKNIFSIVECFCTSEELRDYICMLIDVVDMATEIRKYGKKASDVVKKMDFIFKSRSEFLSFHDIITDYYNTLENEYAEKAFEKLEDNWKKFSFSDDEFLITYPKSPTEVINEGVELHHCVKTYISKVAEGKTNIFFLRKKDEPDKPYFTIEVTNNSTIRQIHGFSNCILEKDSKEYIFVKKWAKDNGLSYGNINRCLGAN